MFFGGKSRRKITVQLELGQLEFKLGEEVWEADLVALKLMLEQLEKKHGLTSVDGNFVATNEFLAECGQALSALGCPSDTPSISRQVWISVTDAFMGADLAFRRSLTRALR
tara:strand:- start:5803 stop:6135 length:333 start_codon:yes stop_codon:yes gene_type:complete